MWCINHVLQMTSKLESYTEVILPALAQGRSYRAVADELLRLGVEITAQSIWSWHTRRVRRIERHRLKYSGAGPLGEVAQPSAPRQDGLPASVPTLAPALAQPASDKLQSLRNRIENEARQQEVNPWVGLGTRFPVPR